MMDQRIHHGAIGRAGCRMNHHASGFINHDQIVILINHDQRDIFANDITLDGRFNGYCDFIACRDLEPRVFDHRTVDCHSPRFDQTPQTRTAQIGLCWHIARKRLIKTRRRIFRDGKRYKGMGHGSGS